MGQEPQTPLVTKLAAIAGAAFHPRRVALVLLALAIALITAGVGVRVGWDIAAIVAGVQIGAFALLAIDVDHGRPPRARGRQ